MTASQRGADVLAGALAALGVQRVFALSGNQIMSVFDACLDVGIELVHVRHEAAAVHMADAWGRLVGCPGVALVTAGPGHANALGAAYTALAAESPLILLSGHAETARVGHGAFQEMPQAELARAVCKAAWTVARDADLAAEVARAMRLASTGRPGPVHLGLPVDVLDEAPASVVTVALGGATDEQPQPLDEELAARIVDRVRDAQRPLVIGGPAMCHGADQALLGQLADVTGAPAVGMESPRGLRDPALGAFARVLARADLVLLLGKPLDFTLGFGASPGFADDARFVLVDPDPDILARSAGNVSPSGRVIGQVVADPLPAARALVRAGGAPDPAARAWRDEVDAAVRFRPPGWARIGHDVPLHPAVVCAAVQVALWPHPDAVVVCDGGEFGQWAQACLQAGTRLINGPAGSIGSALPMGIAAGMARPGVPVVVLLGDGTFGFHPAELDTAVRYGVPVVVVVGNDARWNAEYQIQVRRFGIERARGCTLLPTRYDQVGEGFGARGFHAQTLDGLTAALEAALGAGGPACVDVTIRGEPAPEVSGDER